MFHNNFIKLGNVIVRNRFIMKIEIIKPKTVKVYVTPNEYCEGYGHNEYIIDQTTHPKDYSNLEDYINRQVCDSEIIKI